MTLGVEIEILHGMVIPWVEGSTSMYKDFTTIIRKQRSKYKKEGNELYSGLWKLVGNSLYGKTLQGCSNSKGFDLATGLSKNNSIFPRDQCTLRSVLYVLCSRYNA